MENQEYFLGMISVWLIVSLFFILRIFGAVYCAKKAESLNRNVALWAIFGLLFPIIAIICVKRLKKGIKWHDT